MESHNPPPHHMYVSMCCLAAPGASSMMGASGSRLRSPRLTMMRTSERWPKMATAVSSARRMGETNTAAKSALQKLYGSLVCAVVGVVWSCV